MSLFLSLSTPPPLVTEFTAISLKKCKVLIIIRDKPNVLTILFGTHPTMCLLHDFFQAHNFPSIPNEYSKQKQNPGKNLSLILRYANATVILNFFCLNETRISIVTELRK